MANAVDNLPEFPRAKWVDEERRMLASVGLSAFELDLRGYYQRPGALAAALAEVDLVWTTGGNVFVLRDALQRSQLDRLLTDRVGDGSLAYGGCSAGACVSCPDPTRSPSRRRCQRRGEPHLGRAWARRFLHRAPPPLRSS